MDVDLYIDIKLRIIVFSIIIVFTNHNHLLPDVVCFCEVLVKHLDVLKINEDLLKDYNLINNQLRDFN